MFLTYLLEYCSCISLYFYSQIHTYATLKVYTYIYECHEMYCYVASVLYHSWSGLFCLRVQRRDNLAH